MAGQSDLNVRPAPDAELVEIAEYVAADATFSDAALDTARYCLMDSIACGLMALDYEACRKHLGPFVPGTVVPGGVRVPGTAHVLDPVKGAFDIGCIVRWLDYNDTWLAAEWGHPSDNLGAILSLGDYLCQQAAAEGRPAVTVRHVLDAMIKAHEVQGVLALKNAFNRLGIDHVVLVKIASTAVAMKMLGGTKSQIIDALSQAFVDGQAMRTYRHAPNAGPRKSWAAGDATSRAVRLALITANGEPGLPAVLSAPKWGFYDVLFRGQKLAWPQPFGSYVMENILFKISYPAEFHAQTAVECALQLHPHVKGRIGDIAGVEIATQESAVRIISKVGPLYNYADRDHCLQYIVAVALIHGKLDADSYLDAVASDPRVDALRAKMTVREEPRYSREYMELDKRSIANAIKVTFTDGGSTPTVEVEYPVGHRRRRAEGIPLLVEKARAAFAKAYGEERAAQLLALMADRGRLEAMPVSDLMSSLASGD